MEAERTAALKAVFSCIDAVDMCYFSELVDSLRLNDEWDLAAFVLANAAMFTNYFMEKRESLFDADCTDETDDVTETTRSKFSGLTQGLIEFGANGPEIMQGLQNVEQNNPNADWEKISNDMKDGIYFIVGAMRTSSNGLALAGMYVKKIGREWIGFCENDGTKEHMMGYEPVAYDKKRYMELKYSYLFEKEALKSCSPKNLKS